MGKMSRHILNMLFPVDEAPKRVDTPDAKSELNDLDHRLAAAVSRFQFAESDGEIETAISDLNALERRRRLLLEQIKAERPR